MVMKLSLARRLCYVRIPYLVGVRLSLPGSKALGAKPGHLFQHNTSSSLAETAKEARRYVSISPRMRAPGILLVERSPSHPHLLARAGLIPSMFQRRSNSSKSSSKDGVTSTSTDEAARSECENIHEHADGLEHANGHSHTHTHSHSIFHSHSHDDHGHVHDAEQIVQALEGTGDRGSRITLIGLLVNVVLTSAKGAAGWYMHSASLLADAGHSLSDLLGDFVTLFCWKLSRKPPSERYPFGYAKFETLGTTTVSVLLIGGALGIGFHSYHLLVDALSNTVSTIPPGQLHDLLQQMASVGHHVPTIGHAHAQVDVLDPNAAWFAAVSVLTKEWLYRITKKVADEEHSPVLYANAVHHRSDAYSSVVALFAILGSSIFPAVPLDPIGGLLVSFIIFWQGLALLRGAFAELTDAGIPKTSCDKLLRALDPLLSHGVATKQLHFDDPSKQHLLAIRELRAKRAGSLITVDLTVDVPSTTTVLVTVELESKITQLLKKARKEISEVRVKFRPTDDILL